MGSVRRLSLGFDLVFGSLLLLGGGSGISGKLEDTAVVVISGAQQ